jgi:membrane-bound ClpP family serine protease
MDKTEIDELVTKSRTDGARLYQVSDWLYKLLVVLTALVGLLGLVLSFVAAGSGGPVALVGGLVATCIVVLLLYSAAVLSTHLSKVLVHLLFVSLANLDREIK